MPRICNVAGQEVTVVAPTWDHDKGKLLDIDERIDPLILRSKQGIFYIMLLCEGQKIHTRFKLDGLFHLLPSGNLKLTDMQNKANMGTFSKDDLQKGINIKVENFKLIRVSL